jgi:hypothetical protein
MKVQIKRSGGVTGLLLPPVTVDSDALPSEESRKLHELIRAADFFNLPAKSPPSPRGADYHQYAVTVDDGGRTHKVQISEEQMPESLRTLVQWLPEAMARSGSPDKSGGMA